MRGPLAISFDQGQNWESPMAGAAFWDGYNARLKGDVETRCPYAAGSAKHSEWLEGWHDEIVYGCFGATSWQNPSFAMSRQTVKAFEMAPLNATASIGLLSSP